MNMQELGSTIDPKDPLFFVIKLDIDIESKELELEFQYVMGFVNICDKKYFFEYMKCLVAYENYEKAVASLVERKQKGEENLKILALTWYQILIATPFDALCLVPKDSSRPYLYLDLRDSEITEKLSEYSFVLAPNFNPLQYF